MKPFFLFLLLLTGTLPAQQTAFRQVTSADNFRFPAESFIFSDVFADPGEWTTLTIDFTELQYARRYNFAQLDALEEVQIKFYLDPLAPDSVKKAFTDSIAACMQNMRYFAKCPNLKHVVFSFGERLYLSQEQSAYRSKKEERNHEAYLERCMSENLVIAWNSFGKEVSAMLPGITLYATGWNG